MVDSQVISQQLELMRGRVEWGDGCSAKIQAACCICHVYFNKKKKKKEDWETAGAALHTFEKSSYQNLKIPDVLPKTNRYIKDTN